MSHPDEGVLQELLDGELLPADAAAVRAHLAGCVPCAVILRDLGATQAEADAIVARLPLDPPLVRPATRARPRRPMNLRAIGLAASVVLVAGTSWMLLRSPGTHYLRDSNDSPAGLALPMPGEERQEVPATTPAAPTVPSAGARADAGADQRAKAKQAPAEADTPGKATVKDLPSRAEPQEGIEAEKKEALDTAPRANDARSANAPASGIRMVPAPASPARLATGKALASGTMTSVADAESRLGRKLRSISGLTPVAVELLPPAADSLQAVRQSYLVSGVTVVLIQHGLPTASRDEVTLRAREPEYAMDSLRVSRSDRGCGYIDDCGKGTGTAVRVWEAWGSLFELRGDLPPDSLDALMKRVK
jgi:hypothetical protein